VTRQAFIDAALPHLMAAEVEANEKRPFAERYTSETLATAACSNVQALARQREAMFGAFETNLTGRADAWTQASERL